MAWQGHASIKWVALESKESQELWGDRSRLPGDQRKGNTDASEKVSERDDNLSPDTY
jgi:hypothetical protein